MGPVVKRSLQEGGFAKGEEEEMIEETTGSRHIYLELEDPTVLGDLTEALISAGIKTKDVRAATKNHNGIIMTQLLINGVWNDETGYNGCDGKCENGSNVHREYGTLSEEQQEIFAKDVAQDMEWRRNEHYLPRRDELGEEDFKGVAMGECDW